MAPKEPSAEPGQWDCVAGTAAKEQNACACERTDARGCPQLHCQCCWIGAEKRLRDDEAEHKSGQSEQEILHGPLGVLHLGEQPLPTALTGSLKPLKCALTAGGVDGDGHQQLAQLGGGAGIEAAPRTFG